MRKTRLAVLLSAIMLGSYGCASDSAQVNSTSPETSNAAVAQDMMSDYKLGHAQASTDGNVITVTYDAVSDEDKYVYWPHIRFEPQGELWNWNAKGSLKLQVENPSDAPLNIVLKLSDRVGLVGSAENAVNYAVTIPANSVESVEMLFNGTQRKLPGYFGGEKLDLRNLAEFQIYVQGPADEQQALLSQFELIDATGDFIESTAKVVEASSIPTVKVLSDFNAGDFSLVSMERSVAVETQTVKSAKQDKALEVVFKTESDYPNISFRPAQPWNWADEGRFNLAFDIENPSDDPLQLYIRVDSAEHAHFGGTADGINNSMIGSMAVAPNSDTTYYLALTKPSGDTISGMRGEPPRAAYNAQAMTYAWGEEELDLDSIFTAQLFLMQPTQEYKLIINDVRLVPDLASDTSRFAGLIDKFGQYTGSDWGEKVHDDAELLRQGEEELANLGKAQAMSDRTKFGGWAQGPTFEATGFFRTEKIDGQWNLIDPEGHLYFMTGLDNVRMTDTKTMTGIDFAEPKSRDGRKVASELRYSMFTDLPEYDSPLAEAYDYAEFVHKGALEKGEMYSFYLANLMRKFQVNTAAEALETWEQVTLDRMVEWGFTSLGNWADASLYGNERVAYVANGWTMFGGEYKTISSGNDYWGPIPDPFDPDFKQAARVTAEKIAAEVDVNDPWLLGVFIDNEMSWGNTANEANHYGLIVNALSYDIATSPVKQALTKHLQAKFGSIDELNQRWGADVSSWEEFGASYEDRDRLSKDLKADYGEMLEMISSQYFSVVQAEVAKVLPHHMYLGARFADWGITPEVARGAAPHVDVMSYNLYANDLNAKGDWSRLVELDKPSVIGEFHFGSTDTGLFHGGIVTTPSQAERGKMYTQYMNSILDNPYFVGAHWFQYTDSPSTGRAWDGENYNVGFVTVTDTPYQKLVEEAKAFNATMYQKRFSKMK